MNNLINNKILIISLITLILMSSLNFVFYSGNWSGDPEIHLVFAKNLLEGFPLQFNKGELTSGNTSPLHVILLSVLLLIFPFKLVPFIVKFLSLISIIFLTIFISKNCIETLKVNNKKLEYLFIFSFFSFPFIFFQGWLGMENCMFALIYCYIVISFYKNKICFTNEIKLKTIAFFLFLSLLFFYRPEIIFLIFSLMIYFLIRKKFKVFFIALFFLIFTFNIPLIFESILNVPLHGAGEIRIAHSKSQSIILNFFQNFNIYINTKPFRLFVYLGIFILLSLFFLKHNFSKLLESKNIFLSINIFTPWLLHIINVLPNFHFSRYSLYFFFLIPFFLIKILNLERIKINFNFLCIILVLNSVFAFVIENKARNIWFDRVLDFRKIKEISQRYDDNYISSFNKDLCKKTECHKNAVTNIGISEVQIRLLLDDKFMVRSLDGVVDYKLSNYVYENDINLIDYIKFRKIDYLLEFPDNSPNNKFFSLTKLQNLKIGESIKVQSIEFLKLEKNLIKVIRS